ncbi:MAG: hypothetical protein NWE95_04500 [Candidatus Bathyarchaeota archaeon]|nr:hypothetical protein [Candidatus Bathyarchaeota archaeon]
MVSLLFLGQLTIQANALLPYLSRHGYQVTAINTSKWASPEKIADSNISVFNLYSNSIGKILLGKPESYRKIAFYKFVKNLNLKNDLSGSFVNAAKADLVYASWGSLSLPEVGLLQRYQTPIVYEFLTYPTVRTGWAEKTENFFSRHIINSLDGRIFSTKRMAAYFSNKFGLNNGKNLVFMECYPKKYYYQKRLPLLSEIDGQPHIVFIGMDVDDILPEIERVSKNKIHVHFCDLKQAGWPQGKSERAYNSSLYVNGSLNKNYVHTFNRFSNDEISDGTFATFLTQFDACLVTYDFWRGSSLNRFSNSIPSRFSIALLAGIPIIIPGGYLKGCEDIIKEHRIGFTYRNYSDLKNKLFNRNLLSEYQINAINNRSVFSLENNFSQLDNFLKNLI